MKFLKFILIFVFIRVSSQGPNHSKGESSSKKNSESRGTLTKECGCRFNANKNIINGRNAYFNIPWQIGLFFKKSSNDKPVLFCSGSIINKFFVITSALCLNEKSAENIEVRVDMNDLTDNDENKIYNVEQIFLEDSYKPSWGFVVSGNIAILKLAKPLKIKPGYVEPACFNFDKIEKYNDESKIEPYGTLIGGGFGVTERPRESTDIIEEVEETKHGRRTKEVKRYRHGELSNDFRISNFYQVDEESIKECKDFLLCVIGEKRTGINQPSICAGDFGGPLNYSNGGIIKVVAIASMSQAKEYENGVKYFCDKLSSYTRLSSYSKFFTKIVKNEYCEHQQNP